MKSSGKHSLFKVFLFIILAEYISVCFFAFSWHNHKPDAQFHDNCPACQWQVQSQGDGTSIDAVMDSLIDPLVLTSQNQVDQSINLFEQDFQFTNASRAPPVFI